MPYKKEEILNLPPKEKYKLATQLWDDLNEIFLDRIIANKKLERELQRRIRKIENNHETLIPWKEVLRKMN